MPLVDKGADVHTCSYQCDLRACIRAQRDQLATDYAALQEKLESSRETNAALVRGRCQMDDEISALQAKLDAVTKDAERLSALIDGRAGLVPIEGGAWDVYVYDEGGKETLLATRTNARDAIDAALTDQGRAGEGGRG